MSQTIDGVDEGYCTDDETSHGHVHSRADARSRYWGDVIQPSQDPDDCEDDVMLDECDREKTATVVAGIM